MGMIFLSNQSTVVFGRNKTVAQRTANRTAIQNFLNTAASQKNIAVIDGGDIEIGGLGELITKSNLHVLGSPGTTIYPCFISYFGAIITNGDEGTAAALQSNIVLENIHLNFAGYPALITATARGGGANTITLAANSSSVTNYYNNLLISLASGTGSPSAAMRIIAYNGVTKVATVSPSWVTQPVNGTVYKLGGSDNGIAFGDGASNIRIIGGSVTGTTWGTISDGKALCFDQGIDNLVVDGFRAENCWQGVFIQGKDGNWANGSEKKATNVKIINCDAYNCGTALFIIGVDATSDPAGTFDYSNIIVDNFSFTNCGHAPLRFVGSDHQKSGAIVFGEAQGVTLTNVRGYNSAPWTDALTYPTDYTTRIGYGLSGPPGAAIWGWGREIKISNFVVEGDFDSIIRINRARALGDDASGKPQNVYEWNISGLRHKGTAGTLLKLDTTASVRVDPSELRMRIEAETNVLSTGIVGPEMAAYNDVYITAISPTSNTRKIEGLASDIYAAGNTFASFPVGYTILGDTSGFSISRRSSTALTGNIADDAVVTITPSSVAGFFTFWLGPDQSPATGVQGTIYYNVGGNAYCELMTNSANVSVGAGALTAGTANGVDTDLNVFSHTDGQLYIKNRLGAARNWSYYFDDDGR